MAATTRKCPMCAEEVPAEATVCPFCDTQLAAEPAPASAPPQAQPLAARPAPKTARTRRAIGPGIAGLVLVGIVAAAIWVLSQGGTASLLPPTPRPTTRPDYAATQQERDANATVTGQASWVQGFAQPILDDVRNRRPNFEDDFTDLTGVFVRWNDCPFGVTFSKGVLHVDTTDHDWIGAGGSMVATNFVLEFEFVPRTTQSDIWIGATFRQDPTNNAYHFGSSVGDSDWWELTAFNSNDEMWTVVAGGDDIAGLNRTTRVIIIVRGNELAFYINGQPKAHVFDDTAFGDWIGLGVWSPSGTSIVDFDNVKLWDLDDLQ